MGRAWRGSEVMDCRVAALLAMTGVGRSVVFAGWGHPAYMKERAGRRPRPTFGGGA